MPSAVVSAITTTITTEAKIRRPKYALADAGYVDVGCGRGAGDADGDGVPDIATRSYSVSPGGTTQAGYVTVWSGATGTPIRTISGTSEPGSNDSTFDTGCGYREAPATGALALLSLLAPRRRRISSAS